ncbi:MAG TPA: GNAT family N-acetyltransferase [Gemmataceae bacterium]|nr:GNAT family N-acetyltransferase [Gemmataceae bacterium]
MQETSVPADAIAIRTDLRPGDLGAVVRLHGLLYAQERGFDPTFEAYVAAPLADFVRRASDRERLWLAERGADLVGCIAIVAAAPQTAQLRWFLVDPSCRGAGLGRKLLHAALDFCKACGCAEVVLWTESALTAAARLYQSAGFRRVEQKPGRLGGVDVVEERYELPLNGPEAAAAHRTAARKFGRIHRGRAGDAGRE